MSAVLAVAVATFLALGGPPASAASLAETPHAKALYEDGPNGRYLLGGRWLYRPDPGDRGIAGGFFRTPGTAGWRPVTVPNALNAGDFSQESFNGSVGWYRKDFTPPSLGSGLRWAFRFESVN